MSVSESGMAAAASPAQRGQTPEGSAVQLHGLSKSYGDVRALSEVSLQLAPGSFLALLGPSGSGKSTLIRCLAGIERPSGGTISLGGALVASAERQVPPERRDLAMVFQDFALWPHMSVTDNVRFALRRRRVRKDESRRMAVAMLDRVGIAHKSDRYPHELSGGEQQRVALARALVGKPRLLLFDEPLSSLDASLRERLRIEIGTLVRESGASAVYITHDQAEAFALGDEVGVLEAGRLVQVGAPESIYRRPATAFVARFTGLSGSLSGRLIGPAAAGADLARVAVPTDDPGRILELEATATVPLAPGAAVQVLVRPAAVTVCLPEEPIATLVGTVRDVAFCGRGYVYVIEIGSRRERVGVFEKRRLRRGERCGLVLDIDGCHVFAAEAAAPAPGPLPVDALPPEALRDGAGALPVEQIERLWQS